MKKPKTLKGWHGATVSLIASAKNMLAELPAGTVGTVRKGGRGLEFTSTPCECCGAKISISRMSPAMFNLIKLPEATDGKAEE